MQMMADVIVFIFAAIRFWKGLELTLEAYEGDWTTDSIYEFPLWIPYASMPIGFGLLALQSIACLIKVARGEDDSGSGGH